jgi:hypothetical protein
MSPITGPSVPTFRPAWATCSTCWGQRRIFEDHNGEGLVAELCPDCLGIGEVVRRT